MTMEKENEPSTLVEAARCNNKEAVQRFLNESVSPDQIDVTDREGYRPLGWAAQHGSKDIARLLLEYGADVNAKNNMRQSPLIIATHAGESAMVQLLLENHADVTITDLSNWYDALKYAIDKNYEAIAVQLIKAGSSVNEENRDGFTPLMVAALRGHISIINLLLENGADITQKNKSCRTALDAVKIQKRRRESKEKEPVVEYDQVIELLEQKEAQNINTIGSAILADNLQVVQDFIKAGNDINQYCRVGFTLLHIACYSKNKIIAELLIQNGADINRNTSDNSTGTPLHYAAHHGHADIVGILIENGADINQKDGRGKTALDMAKQFCDKETGKETIDILTQAEIKQDIR